MTNAIAAVALAILAATYGNQLDKRLSEFGEAASVFMLWACTIAAIVVLVSI